jgi:hypothetical protein
MYFNFVPDLFLECAELIRFRESLDDNGFRKALLEDSVNFGLVKNSASLSFQNGRVERDVDNALNQKTIKIGAIAAIDNQGKLITNPQVNNLPIQSNGNWYWIRIKHQYSTLEAGKVTLDATGNLTGVGTEFTKVLRGNPNFASVIRFSNSVGNTLEYEVLEITDDTHCVIVHPSVTGGGDADFVAESNLSYEIIGTFTDGVAVPIENKLPFKYDSCLVELVAETSFNVRPTFTVGQEFYLARVRVVNGNLVIQDKRVDYWETKGSARAIDISRVDNPLIGVEAAKWQNLFNTGDRNIVEIAWGMRSSNWSVDSSQNIITFFGSSQGGSFKTTDDFTDGDFNGWRLYTKSGKYRMIVNSIKQGSAINLYLDTLDVDDYSTDGGNTFTGAELLAVPDCDSVELKFIPDSVDLIFNVEDNDKFTFPVNTPVARCLPTVYKDPTNKYIVLYRHKSFKEFSQWQPIVSGSYFTERSFNDNGSLKTSDLRIIYNYVADPLTAFVQLEISPNSWKKFKETVYKGDIIGVHTITEFAQGQTVELKVGVAKRYQYITGVISLDEDVYISLSRTGAVQGNEFRIHIECDSLALGDKKIIIADDYSSGTLLVVKEITQADSYAMKNQDGGLVIDCVFDDNGKWIAYQNYDLGTPFAVEMFSGDIDASFDATGLGKVKGYFGKALMNGNNGTDDVSDRFMLASKTTLKQMGGVDSVILDIENVPPHGHPIKGRNRNANTSGNGSPALYVDGGPDSRSTELVGGLGGAAKPFVIKPKHYTLAFVQKLY